MGRVLPIEDLPLPDDGISNRFRFHFDGPRETLDEEKVGKLLEPLFHILEDHHKHFHDMTSIVDSIRLSGKSLTLPAASVVADTIRDLPPGLREVNFADILASQPTHEARMSLESLAEGLLPHANTIKVLDVSDNALGPAGVKALSVFLSAARSVIEELKFNNDGMAVAACEALADILVNEENSEEELKIPLRVFELYNNLAENQGGEAIARVFTKCPMLEHVRVSSTRIGAEGGLALAKSLQTSNCLISVDFSDNTFDDEGFEELSKALEKQSHLKRLVLSNLDVSSIACELICKALIASNCSLEVLDLSGNELPEESASAIAKVIIANPSLKTLNLEENELGSAGIVLLSHVISPQSKVPGDSKTAFALESINFRMNQVTSTAMPSILAMVRSQRNSLKSLDLNSNTFSSSSVESLESLLKELLLESVLCEFDENDEDVEEEEEVDIADLLENLSI